MNDPGLVALASQFSFPPSLMFAVHTMAHDKSDQAMAVVARSLNQAFQQTRSWEGALSTVITGDPHAHNNPSLPSAGKVNAILGIAASRPGWGMSNWQPVDPQRYAFHVKAMERTSKSLAQLGGVVTPEHVQAWSTAITRLKNRDPHQSVGIQEHQPLPRLAAAPSGVNRAKEVGEFGNQLKAMGATPEHFKQLFPHVASVRRRLLGQTRVSVDDFAAHVGQTPDLVLQSVRAMPHPKSPDVTAGDFHDAWQTAQLHSIHHVGRMPYVSEISKFTAAKMSHRDMDNYYQRMAQKKAGQETTLKQQQPDLKVMEGGG